MRNWKYCLVTLISLPALNWACTGVWTPGTDKWGVGTNWPGCSPNYPGQVGTTDVAQFSGNSPTAVIVGDSGGTGISPNIQGLFFSVASYALNPGTGTSQLNFFNNSGNSSITASTANNHLNVPLKFNNPGTASVVVTNGGELFFSQVSDLTNQNMSFSSNGSTSGNIYNSNNINGFVINGTLTLNSLSGDLIVFNHQNNAAVNSGSGSLLSVGTLDIKGGASNAGLKCENLGSVDGPNVFGTRMEALAGVNLSSQGSHPARLTLTNLGTVTDEGKGSYLTTPSFQGTGTLLVSNHGNVSSPTNNPSVGAGLELTGNLDFHGTANFTNFSDQVNSGGVGVRLLGDLISSVYAFDEVVLSNLGNIATNGGNFAYGIFCQTGELTFRSHAEISNSGNFSINNTATATGVFLKANRLEFTGDASRALIANRGNVLFSIFQPTSASIGVDIISNSFIKSGKGILTTANTGNIGVNQGLSIVNIGPGNIVMNEGTWEAVNSGSVSNPMIVGNESIYGVLITTQAGIEVTGGEFSLQNTGVISDQGVGVGLLASSDYVQTGGRLTLIKTPQGFVDSTSLGAILVVSKSILISGGTLENNEIVLLKGLVNLTGSGVVKGTGVFAGLSAKLFDLGFFTSFNNSGRVIPGNSPGTLTCRAPYVQSSAGTLEIHICNQACSQLNVVGPARLAGTLQLVADPSCQLGCDDQFTILQASSGVTGTFEKVLDNFGKGVTPLLAYLPHSVVLSFKCEPCFCPPPLCAYLGNVTQTLFASLTDTNNFFIKRQVQRIQEKVITPEKAGHVYAGPLGSVGRSAHEPGEVGFHYGSIGGIVGGDYALPQGGVGGLVCYEWIGSCDVECGWGNFHVQRAHGSVYGTYVPKTLSAFSLDLMLGGGYDAYHITRSTSSGSPNGYELDGMFSMEYRAALGDYHVTPMANLQYIFLHIDDYAEEGGRPICYDDQRARSLSTILGVWGERTWKWRYPLTSQLNLGWQREYLNHDRTLHSSVGRLIMEGSKRNNLLAGLDLLLQIKEGWSVEGSYDLIWNSQFSRNGFYLGINASF